MDLEPRDWSVVVVARWNLAILTPAGIGKYVFGLPADVPMEVLVPMDGLSPYIVRHPKDGIRAKTEQLRLLIEPEQMNYDTLDRAKQAAVCALTLLPVTPVVAAGINVGFGSPEPLEEVLRLLDSDIDRELTDATFTVASRTVVRSLKHGDGLLNVSISVGEKGSRLLCNFHRQSDQHEHLRDWLGAPVADIRSTVERLFGALHTS